MVSVLFDTGEIAELFSRHFKKNDDRSLSLTRDTLYFSDLLSRKGEGWKVDWVTHGHYGYVFKLQDPTGGFWAIKVIPFINHIEQESYAEEYRSENVELNFIMATSRLERPWSIKFAGHVYGEGFPVPNKESYDQILSLLFKMNRIRQSRLLNRSLALVCEWCNMGDLFSELRFERDGMVRKSHSVKWWKTVLFQILFALVEVDLLWPGWRHNDLSARNILLCSSQKLISEWTLPGVDHIKWVFEDKEPESEGGELWPRVLIKLWDFGLCYQSEHFINSRLACSFSKDFGITTSPNRYFDLHYFFNFLMVHLDPRNVPAEVYLFMNDVVPSHIRGEKGEQVRSFRYVGSEEVWTPLRLLKEHSFFAELRHEVSAG